MPRNLTDESLTVALVDDDPLVRTYLDQLLQDAGLRVLWTAAGASEAVTTLRRSATLPDVVAIDVRMPGTDGHQLTRMLLSEFTALKVVMLTSVDDPHSMSTAIAAGALGYLVKTDPPESIALGLRAAASGLRPLSAAVQFHVETTPTTTPEPSPLTQREHEVLQLLSQSFTNDQIARRMQISRETVKNHVSAILRKLEVPDRMSAAMWGVRNRVLD